MSKTIMYEVLEAYIKVHGLKVAKKLTSAHYGFFSHSEATWDERTVYSFKELNELDRKGFGVSEDIGFFMFNAFEQANIEDKKIKKQKRSAQQK